MGLDVFDALSHPTRRAVLEMLRRGGRTAGELADAFPVSKPTMSAHFAKLRAAGLVQAENRRGSVIYTLNLSVVEAALNAFMDRLQIGRTTKEEEACPENREALER